MGVLLKLIDKRAIIFIIISFVIVGGLFYYKFTQKRILILNQQILILNQQIKENKEEIKGLKVGLRELQNFLKEKEKIESKAKRVKSYVRKRKSNYINFDELIERLQSEK